MIECEMTWVAKFKDEIGYFHVLILSDKKHVMDKTIECIKNKEIVSIKGENIIKRKIVGKPELLEINEVGCFIP